MFDKATDIGSSRFSFAGRLPSVGQISIRVQQLWQEWKQRRRFRNELYRLMRISPHLIVDIGLTEEEALREIAKPFWRE